MLAEGRARRASSGQRRHALAPRRLARRRVHLGGAQRDAEDVFVVSVLLLNTHNLM